MTIGWKYWVFVAKNEIAIVLLFVSIIIMVSIALKKIK